MAEHKLVLIEWEDSEEPAPKWRCLEPIKDALANVCSSAGWLISDGELTKVLAPNMANMEDPDSVQVSGVIKIPSRSVVSITALDIRLSESLQSKSG